MSEQYFNDIDAAALDHYRQFKTPLWFPSPGANIPYNVTLAQAEGQQGDPLVAKVIGVDHLPCGENKGKNNLFFQLLDTDGSPMVNALVRGVDSANINHNVRLDKPPNERANMPMWSNIDWHRIWVAESAPGQIVNLSSTTEGYSTRWADECAGDVTFGHHSFYVVFQMVDPTGEPPPEPPPGNGGCDPQEIDAIKAKVQKSQADLNQVIADLGVVLTDLEKLKSK